MCVGETEEATGSQQGSNFHLFDPKEIAHNLSSWHSRSCGSSCSSLFPYVACAFSLVGASLPPPGTAFARTHLLPPSAPGHSQEKQGVSCRKPSLPSACFLSWPTGYVLCTLLTPSFQRVTKTLKVLTAAGARDLPGVWVPLGDIQEN